MIKIPKYAYQKRMYVNNDMDFLPGQFSSYDKEAMQEACRYLNGSAGYILWIIYAGNADQHEEDLSPAWMMKNYGISENTYRNGMDDLRKFGYIIDHVNDSYGLEFYCKTVIPSSWIPYIPKTRTGKKSEFGNELKQKYADLIQSGAHYMDYSLEEQ